MNMNMPTLRFSVEENILKTELFKNNDVTRIIDLPARVFLKLKSKIAVEMTGATSG